MNEVQKTLATPGWAIIEKRLDDEMDKIMDFQIGDKTPEAIAAQCIGRREAKRIIKKMLSDVKKTGQLEGKKKTYV